MNRTATAEKGNLVRLALLKQATALHEQAKSLEVLAELAETEATSGPVYLDEAHLFERFGLKKASADARGIPRLRIGRRTRWLLTDVERAIRLSPVSTKPRKSELTGVNEDPIDAMVRRGELRAVKGGT